MLLSQYLAVTLVLAPSLVSAGLFPKNTQVKFAGPKKFKAALEQNITMVVAFVAPWCGHCQKMGPMYSQAALGLYPLVPFYAVDCDKETSKPLCAQQGVQGFPTVKLFPRGGQGQPVTFEGERSASSFYYFVQRNLPHVVKKIYHLDDVPAWVNEHKDRTRALLVNNGKHIPMLWQVLSNKYKDDFTFGIHRDRHGKSSVKMGMEAGEKGSSKVLIYPPGETDWVRYEGINKYDSLTKFFDSIVDGTANLEIANKEAADEEFVPDEKELEIEREQEAQRIALAHGGYSDLIDFEEAIKQYGTDFHGKHGFPGSMGNMPLKGQKAGQKAEDPMKKILKSQSEEAARSAESQPMMKTGDGGQIVFDPVTETGHIKTSVAEAAPSAEATPPPEPTPSTDAEQTPVEEHAASPTPIVDEARPVDTEAEAGVGEETVASKPTIAEEATASPDNTGHVKDEL